MGRGAWGERGRARWRPVEPRSCPVLVDAAAVSAARAVGDGNAVVDHVARVELGESDLHVGTGYGGDTQAKVRTSMLVLNSIVML